MKWLFHLLCGPNVPSKSNSISFSNPVRFQIQSGFASDTIYFFELLHFQNLKLFKIDGASTSHKYLRESINKCTYFAHSSYEFINSARSP